MKLLILNWQDRLNPQAGGAEVHLHEIFGRLASRGHEVSLLVSGWADAAEMEVVDGMAVFRAGNRYTYPLAAPLYYRRHLARRRFDLVLEDLNKVPLWSPVWARSPVVLLVHHLFGGTAFSSASLPVATTTWLSERPLRLVYRRSPVQVVSESTARDLVRRGFSPERIHVVHNGVDLEFFTPGPGGARTHEPTLVYVGRLQKYKRVDLVIRALAALRDTSPAARLIVAGRGSEEAALRRLATRLGVANAVEFVGFVDEVHKRDLLRAAWVHVLTSPKEGWGLTVIEAAACGTPTIASDAPGLRDSVVRGRTGILVPHGDEAELVRQLRLLASDREQVERMGLAARQRAELFSWDHSADEAERHLLACLAAKD